VRCSAAWSQPHSLNPKPETLNLNPKSLNRVCDGQRRDLLEDVICPDTPGSLVRTVNLTLTEEDKREVERLLARLPPPPPNMTHVDAAVMLDFPTEMSRREVEVATPAWATTDDVVLEYGVLKRMDKRQMARYVFEQTVRGCAGEREEREEVGRWGGGGGERRGGGGFRAEW